MDKPIIRVKSSPGIGVNVVQKHTVIPNDYNNIKNKPTINGETVVGDLDYEQLKLLSSEMQNYSAAEEGDKATAKVLMFTEDGNILLLPVSELQKYGDLQGIPTFDGKVWKGTLTAEELSLLTSALSSYQETTLQASADDKIVILSTGGEKRVLTLSTLLEYIKSFDSTEQITVDDNGDIEATIKPNIYYLFTGEITSLSISFGEAQTSRYNEFKGQFSTGATVPTVSFPTAVKWIGETFPELEADRTYQFSIVNNIGVIVGV